jgi:hypothetical protein
LRPARVRDRLWPLPFLLFLPSLNLLAHLTRGGKVLTGWAPMWQWFPQQPAGLRPKI